ncbi:hypothetical protein B0J14DRAFT_55312 [Halenospora varia]|nr:hypothetical protein B0J14DRAFT_55312 [Halenospora varia]
MATSNAQKLAFRDTDPNHRFNPPQSTFGFNRRMRPPPMHFTQEAQNDSRIPLNPKKLDRRDSKGGLRGMFTRTKVQSDKSIVSPVMEEAPPLSAATEKPQSAVPRTMSMKRSTTAASATTPVTPSRQSVRSSRINLRSKSTKPPKRAPSKTSPKSTKSSPRPPTRTSPAWDPPPLFQAYPQAIKHATLSASTLSADAILRLSNHRRNNSLRDDIAQTGHDGDGNGQNPAAKKAAEKKSKHRRQISGSISKAEWTQKIFVLVTSGYLLQYAGDGSFDRLPEKMMQLGKESVAFASDVIPGRHWVLQISQAMDADGSPQADSRSLLSRLAFRGADYRRTATSLLLVLNSAEDMDSWLAVVRREIEALGGKKHASETGKPKPDEKVMQLRAQPSHRYLVQRDPDQFSAPSSPQSPGQPPWSPDGQLHHNLETAATELARAQNSDVHPMNGDHSVTNSVISHDGRQLDSLRDNANRLSYMSSGQRTLVTSQGSSTPGSPTRDSCSTVDDFPPKISMDDVRMRPNASAINERRRSMQTMSIQVLEAHQPTSYRPHSTYGGPSRPIRAGSPTTPNFSVPNSSTKRYSAMKSPPTRREGMNIPDIVTTSARASQEPISSGSECSQNTEGSYTSAPGSGPGSPPRVVVQPPFAPQESALDDLLSRQGEPLPNERRFTHRPLSLLPMSTSSHEAPPPRRTSLMANTALLDFQFPRRPPLPPQPLMEEENEQGPKVPPKPTLLPAPTFPSSLSESPSQYILPNMPDDESTRRINSPLPALPTANTKTKLRRPTSMQICASTPTNGHNHPHSKPSRSPVIPPKHNTIFESPLQQPSERTQPETKLPSPSIQHLRVEESAKTLASRKSMPLLVSGPPPAPPPDCALPPLPSPGVAGKSPSIGGGGFVVKSPPIGGGGFRNSVQV